MANKSTYDLMLSYSPTDNVKQQPYPNMLAIGGELRSHTHTQLPSSLDQVWKGMTCAMFVREIYLHTSLHVFPT